MALSGNSWRSSLANCAASVLLGCITSSGRWSCSATHATVAVLPVPVAPSSTTSWSPPEMRRVISLIAAGWSPDGW